MSLIDPVERLLLNLEEEIDPSYIFLYVNKDSAFKQLKLLTGQDFGYDARQWRQWLETNHHPRFGGGSWIKN
jgi:hypothetical protein